MRDAGRADAVLKQQIPTDDPSEKFAQGCIGVGVSRARHRDHGGEFGVAKRGKSAGGAGDDK